MTSDKVLIGKVVNAHGIRGDVKIKSFTTVPSDLCNYTPLLKSDGTEIKVKLKSPAKSDVIIANIEGIKDRNEAEAIKGMEIYTLKSSITNDEDDILFSELIGFSVKNENDEIIGNVKDILNFGAGDILEINLNDREKTALLSYNKYSIIDQNKEQGFIKIDSEHLLAD